VSYLNKLRNFVNRSIFSTGFQIERDKTYLPFNYPVEFKLLDVSSELKLTNDFLIRFGKNCDILLDVGANRGTFTDLFIKVNDQASIALFEPIPELFKSLNYKYKEKNFMFYNIALSDYEGKTVFNVSSNDGQSSSLLPIGKRHLAAHPKALEINKIVVDVSTLDEICKTLAFSQAFLKVDVQGNELAQLYGSIETLRRTKAVHIEVSIQSIYDGDSLGFEIWELLHKNGFILYGIDPWFRDTKANGELLHADMFFVKS
jgi:FkbM family methyltransferase